MDKDIERTNKAERQNQLLPATRRTLDAPCDNGTLAEEACLSRFHFQRVFRKVMGETPGGFRRRLCLERAAYTLQSTEQEVTPLAFDAGYDSLEGFSRAFRQAYGVSPSHYRRLLTAWYRLPCPNGIHYDPALGTPGTAVTGGRPMDLLDRLMEGDYWLRTRLLQSALSYTDAQLDAPLAYRQNLLPFVEPDRTLREMLDGLADFGAPWMEVQGGKASDPTPDRSVDGMTKRLDISFQEFRAFAYRIRDENRWDECFVDRMCTPPETFSQGGMLAHVITFSTAKRLMALRILQQMGVEGLGFGDPMEWEMQPESGSHLWQVRAAEQA